MTADALEPQLRAGLGALGLDLDDGQVAQLLAYQALIHKWNKIYNLTAVREPEAMLRQHLLDSLAAVPPLRRFAAGRPLRVLDVGSGAGLPGAVFAICNPELQVACVDAVHKKAAFLRQSASELKLKNLQGLHARVETLAGPYDLVCSRAFASLADFVTWSAGALAEQGTWMAMKGKLPKQELADLPTDIEVFHVERLQVPLLDADRCIVWMRRAAGA
ncbi:16S rRNA (guanine(527)-N(7))-methyltransferase RsmG [Caenimonas sedimenti]|uniref:Ribosomal RNA small subunit methyltransferase G n=1 Tax=Caenimonas sedimenti TaxID=2596921 RepID=A0A562ZRA2_9BURK|nr:16S rRNA (guanine(527)-N(7))-methyltransferase RsmG [Caenimonas sedimenti]TWO71063.1 16S rRNA (guanine(527)-N(7))-methyltransferase RsmG [Caenimonas sedimenti]